MMNISAHAGLVLLALGGAHGINPAMGWLFAVARGLQDRSRRAVWGALGPLAVGHAMAIGVAVLAATTLGTMLPLRFVRWIVAAALLSVGIAGLVRHRHVRLGGMRVSPRELATWSFLMASAHGAGLMVLPFMLGSARQAPLSMSHHHMMSMNTVSARPMMTAGIRGIDAIEVTAPLIHTLGYLLVTALIAIVVYEKVGLRILRRAWINLNVVWNVAMIGAGVLAFLG
jgi:hypothetical protein